MTHDELLAKIKELDGTLIFSDGRPLIENVGVGDKVNLALRAVVVLCDKWETKGSYCLPIESVIEAIEKELK